MDIATKNTNNEASSSVIDHIIDCDANPSIPVFHFSSGVWVVAKHRKSGLLKWNKEAQKDAFWLGAGNHKDSLRYCPNTGQQILDGIEKKQVLNANVLDYLLANPDLIPKEWESHRDVSFIGTIYCSDSGSLRYRSIRFYNGKWTENDHTIYLYECLYGVQPFAVKA